MSRRRSRPDLARLVAPMLAAGAIAVVASGIGLAVARPGASLAPTAAPAGPHRASPAQRLPDGSRTPAATRAARQADVLGMHRRRARSADPHRTDPRRTDPRRADPRRIDPGSAALPFTGPTPVAPTLAVGLLLATAGALLLVSHPVPAAAGRAGRSALATLAHRTPGGSGSSRRRTAAPASPRPAPAGDALARLRGDTRTAQLRHGHGRTF